MDVGADEFEQSLPLLQELVLGADFVGKTPDSGPCRPSPWPEHPAEGVARLGQGREVRPSLGVGGSPVCGGTQSGPPKDREIPSLPGQADGKQQLLPWLCCGPGEAKPTEGGGRVVLALAPSVFPS